MAGISEDPLSPGRLRVMQLLAAALLVGVVLFLFIALYMVLINNQGQGLAPPRDLPLITLIAALLLVVNVPTAMVMPRTLTRNALKQLASRTATPPAGAKAANLAHDADSLLTIRQTSLLVALALLEGAAFLGLIAFLMEAELGALAVVAVAALLMLAHFPTERRVRAWLELHLQRLTDLRQQAELSA